MDLYEDMGYAKSNVPAAKSTVPAFHDTIAPGDPDYELAKHDPESYAKKVLAAKKAEMSVSTKTPAGKLDLFDEMYGSGANKPFPKVKQVTLQDEGLWEGLVKPTGEAVMNVGGALVSSLATGAGAIATHPGYMVGDIATEYFQNDKPFKEAFESGALKASDRSIATMEFPSKELLATPEQKESFENINYPLGLSAAGYKGVAELATTGEHQKATDVIEGRSQGSSVLVPIAGAFGDTAFMYALGGKNAVKARWYQMTVKERALVRSAAKDIKANIAADDLTVKQVRELWKDPANKEALQKRFMGVGGEETLVPKKSDVTVRASGATAQDAIPYTGNKVHPLEDLMNILPETNEVPLGGVQGEGFTAKPVIGEVVKRPGFTLGEVPQELPVEYKLRISKNGKPYKTEAYAEKVALGKGMKANEFEVVPTEVDGIKGFGYRRTTPIAATLPIPGQDTITRRIVRDIASERPSKAVVENEMSKPEVKSEYESWLDEVSKGGEELQPADVGVKREVSVKVEEPVKEIPAVVEEQKPVQAVESDVSIFDITPEALGKEAEVQAPTVEAPITEAPVEVSKNKKYSSFNLYSGIDPLETVNVLKGLTKNTVESVNHLSDIGQRIYSSGKTEFFKWRNEFKNTLGELWEQYKPQVMKIWKNLQNGILKPLRNERGSVGYDTSGEKIVKQRELGTLKDGTKLKAPAVTASELKLRESLPDMTAKPLGGFTQNPLYAFEDWGVSVGPKAATWVKDKFYYPIREATHRADTHFEHIFSGTEKIRNELPKDSSQRIYKHALSQETGGQEILKNMGIDEVPKLTPEELKAYNWMRRGYENIYNQINAARIASGVEPFKKVKNYFTFARDMTLAEQLGFGFDDALVQDFVHPKATGFKYALERVGGIQKAQMDGFGIFERYMKSATKHIHLTPEISKMRELIGDVKLEDGTVHSMKTKQPRAYKNITEYLDFVAGKRRELLPKPIENAMSMLSRNLTSATLSGNMRSAFIQPTALHNTYTEIGPKYTARGAIDLMSGKADEALAKSKVLFNREFDVDVKQSFEGPLGKIRDLKKAFNESWLGMKPLKYLDMQTATATWLGAFEKAKEVHGMTEERAIKYADDTVIRTQGSAAAHDLAPMQRIILGRFFGTFQSFVINNFNFLAKDVLGIKNPMLNPKESMHKVSRFVIGATIINVLFEDLLGINSPLPAPISEARKTYKETKDAKATVVSAALELAQVFPGAGGIRYGSSVLGAPADFLVDVSEKISSETGKFKGPTKSWLELAGKATGVPGTVQAAKAIKIKSKGGTTAEALIGKYPENKKSSGIDFNTDKSFDIKEE